MEEQYFLKRCSKCGRLLSSGNFSKDSSLKSGLRSYCKECAKEYREQNKDKILAKQKEYREQNKEKIKEYREQNKEKYKEYNKEYYEANKDKISTQQKEYREQNKEKIKERNKKYYEQNKDKVLAYHKEHYEQNKDKIKEYQKEHYEQNKDKVLAKQREYREQNKDKIKKYREQNKDKISTQQKEYYEANKDKILAQQREYKERNKDKLLAKQKEYYNTPRGQVVCFNAGARRRAKEQAQGNGITKEQWLECMKYFNWECAYSGITLSKETRTIDHIEPLNKGGTNEIWNLVPMTRNLNSSKNDSDMEEWYQQQDFYSEERLAKIREWQEYAFSKWGKDTDYLDKVNID